MLNVLISRIHQNTPGGNLVINIVAPHCLFGLMENVFIWEDFCLDGSVVKTSVSGT